MEYKKIFCLVNIRMIDLSFDELRLIAKIRNIRDYENKSKEDLIKALSELKLETPKPETPKPKTSKTETPKPEKTKPEIRVNKKKFKTLRKDFDELRHKFSKKEIDRYRKAFYVAKNKKYLSESEIKKTNKSLTELRKSLSLKNFVAMILIVFIMKTLIVLIMMMLIMMMINIEKLEALEDYLNVLILIITNQ